MAVVSPASVRYTSPGQWLSAPLVTDTGADVDSVHVSAAAQQRLANEADPLHPGADGWRDMSQGGLNDCYFLAPLRGLAKTDPDAVRRMIAAHPDGSYTVNFHGMEPVTVHGDEIEKPWAAHATDANNHWLPVMEAAWEKAKGKLGFVNVGMGLSIPKEFGGKPAEAAEALTGQKTVPLKNDHARQTLDPRLAQSLRHGDVVTASHDDPNVHMGEVGEDGILNRHSYSVLDIDNNDNVLVVNPLGLNPDMPPSQVEHPDTPPGGRWMTPAEFNHKFDNVELSPGSGRG